MDLDHVPLAHHVARGPRFKSMPRYHIQKVGILLGSDLLRYAVSPPAALDYGKHRTANGKERNRHCAWHDHADSSMR